MSKSMSGTGQEKKRLRAIEDVVRHHKIANQSQLKQHLELLGIQTTQSSISRGLQKLGVIKLGGFYNIPISGGRYPHASM